MDLPEEKPENTIGRPSKFKDVDLNKVMRLSVAALTDEQMAIALDIAVSTLYEWKNKYPEFSEALKKGKESADRRVEHSLFERATGYEHPEIKYFAHEGIVTDERIVTKHYPPDTTAAIFWLKNRKPDEWRDAKDYNHHIEKTPFNDEDLAALADKDDQD